MARVMHAAGAAHDGLQIDHLVGDVVERGGTLGEVGSTGRSTGPHLHYEVFNKDRVINPAQLLTSGSS
jgi:murein DD-endopeptidase MepM/ murein hydrolase activator NlpD